MTDLQTFAEKVIGNVEKVIVGKREAIELTLINLFCQATFLSRTCPGWVRPCWPAVWLVPLAAR